MSNKLQDLQPTRHYTIGIDPDVTKNGVAIVERETRHLECAALTFADTLDYLQWVCSRASEVGATVKVYVEAGWLNNSNWHLRREDGKSVVAKKGVSQGRNEQVSRLLGEMCDPFVKSKDDEVIPPASFYRDGFEVYEFEDNDAHNDSTAISYVRSVADRYGIEPSYFRDHDIHIHIPEGAVPKDGPSAGITMATAILSAITGCKVRCDVAMTGEITLRGRVLPIGGLKEKLLAARNAKMSTVVVPEQNRRDVQELSEEITSDLRIVYARNMEKVLEEALVQSPEKAR